MAQPINLSRELLQQLMHVLQEHDAQCQDTMVSAQYLAAVVGLLVGNVNRPPSEKEELLGEINAFSGHVMNDVINQAQQRPEPPAADPAKAFGIWKPPSA